MNQAQAFLQRKQRRERQNLSGFAALVAAPADLVAGVGMPANGKLFASCAVDHIAVSPLVTLKSVVVNGGIAPAGTRFPIGYVEKDVVVAKAVGAAGVVTLYLEAANGVLIKIAEG